MREFLEDAHAHRDDGYGRAQAHAGQDLPKRFYEEASFKAVDGGFAVLLDGRATKTPGRVPVILPTEGLAQAMVEEWQAQEKLIDAQSMPIVRLVNSALEGGEAAMADLRAEIIKYAGNDALLYRADTPQELVDAQEKSWDAVLVKLAQHFDVKFQPTVGIIHQSQPAQTLERLEASLADIDLLTLTALVSITGVTGSGLLAIALHNLLLDADTAWDAAHVDEDHNARLWGTDPEALARREKRRKEFDAALNVIELIKL